MTNRKQAVIDCFKAMDDHDFDQTAKLHSENCSYRMNYDTMQGAAAFRGMIAAWYGAFPDIKHEVLEYVEEGNKAAWALRITGTHTAPMQSPNGTIPATGKRIDFRAVDFVTFGADGKAQSWNIYFDQLGFLQQLGIVPPG